MDLSLPPDHPQMIRDIRNIWLSKVKRIIAGWRCDTVDDLFDFVYTKCIRAYKPGTASERFPGRTVSFPSYTLSALIRETKYFGKGRTPYKELFWRSVASADRIMEGGEGDHQIEFAQGDEPTGEEVALRGEQYAQLWSRVRRLSLRQQFAIKAWADGWKSKEIGEQLGISKQGADVCVSTALARLKRMYLEDNPELHYD